MQLPQGCSHSQGGRVIAVRNYINGAPLLTLSTAVNISAVTFEVASTSGYPTAPFILALERGTPNEEVTLCTAKTHSIGAAIEHTTSAVDYVEANAHVNADGTTTPRSTDVHAQYLLKTAYAAKGRVIVGTGAGTFSALAVGADATVFQADAAAATGTKWATLGAASITDGVITEAKLVAAVSQGLIARTTPAPAAVNGREYYDTAAGRPYTYINAWRPKTFGAGFISFGTGAPSGGVDGDLYFRYA